VTTYPLTVSAGTGGTVSGTACGSDAAGKAVRVTAKASSGYHFVNWTVSGATIDNTANPATFSMPAGAVTLTANFAPDAPAKYNVAVSGGMGGSYAPGDTVTITAAVQSNGFLTGKRFKEWTGEGVTFADKTKATTTFTMPAQNVTVTATYDSVIRLWGKNTSRASNFMNWLLCIVCFGWIWMAF
jgi:uncharacterized repeat protein (TIGR02543 family)